VAYDEELAYRLREQLSGESYIEKKMFGGVAFLIGGNMSVAASGQGGILVRVGPAQNDALLKEPGAQPMQMSGRGAMTGWLHVSDDALDDDSLARWVRRGVDYAKSLPPK
jgi:TfoX/Sxy family transcriptional regulator of competence genes